jgi:DNA-binding NtrC family response regulator
VVIDDAAAHAEYSGAESIISLRLRSMVCVPMTAGDLVMGAVFLGKRGVSPTVDDRTAAELEIVAAMLVPVLAQLRRVEQEGRPAEIYDLLTGDSPALEAIRLLVRRVASSDLSVLVQGETGAGKEMVARALHGASDRARRPMVALNCAAVPESLLASELFGAKRGAYTGSVTDRKGKIEQADGSTLFLDEVGDMPLAMQAALLRVVEDRTVTRLGDEAPRSVDFRLIAATHRDLEDAVEKGDFRQDLLFRLREVTIVLPRLVDRGNDILILAQLFLRQAAEQLGTSKATLGPQAKTALLAHDWPGNVRELRAAMRRAAVLCDGETVTPAHLQLGGGRGATPSGGAAALDLSRPLADAREEFTARYVQAMVDRHGGNREAAAAALDISLRSLYRYLSGAG